MPTVNKQKQATYNLLIGEKSHANPFAPSSGGRLIQNFIPHRGGYLERKTAAEKFVNTSVAQEVWRIIPFRYQTHYGTDHSELLWVKDDGKIYRKEFGGETEIYPASETGGRVLTNPSEVAWVAANNKLFISDGDQSLVYIGQQNTGNAWFVLGMDAPHHAPDVIKLSTPATTRSLTTGRKYAVSWVHIVNGVRIHESSRSPVASPGSTTNQFYRIIQPQGAPSRATHWSIYASAIDGANSPGLFRRATVLIDKQYFDDNSPDYGETGAEFESSIRQPERNDKPPRSKMLVAHKARIFARNEDNKNEMWFSALGEVRGELNGAGEESFPGFKSDTISDIQNFFDTPDQTSEVSGAVSWSNNLWFFTKKEGYRLQGEGGLLDNLALRDFHPLPAFKVGCAGPHTICQTPFGIAWITPERKVVMFSGGGFATDMTAALIDIGYEKQLLFDRIPDDQLAKSQLIYFMPLNSLVFRFQDDTATNRLYLFSFDLRTKEQLGGWYNFNDVDATCIGTFFDVNKEFLLVGEADGDIRDIGQVIGNAVVAKTESLIGGVILGAASTVVANYPAATFRSNNTDFGYDGAKVVDEIRVAAHRQSNYDQAISATSVPTVAFWSDVLDPENPGSSTAVTMSSATKARNFRGHIGSTGGTYGEHLMVEVSYATGAPEGTADADDFLECHTSRINGLGLVWHPKEEKIA